MSNKYSDIFSLSEIQVFQPIETSKKVCLDKQYKVDSKNSPCYDRFIRFTNTFLKYTTL